MENLKDIQPIILAGGLGTRLRTVVNDRPKVMAEIDGKPFLAYLLYLLKKHGFKEAVISTGYMKEYIQEYFGDSFMGLRLHYCPEETPLGTGGAIEFAFKEIGCSNALVLNGDSFCSADVSPLVALHCKRGALCSILLVEVADVSRYGRVITDDEDNILLFEEKGSYSGSGFINAGIYLIEKRAFELAPASSRYSIEKELFPSLIGKGFYGYKAKEHNKDLIFIDIGTPESYKEASRLLKGFLPPNILP